MQSGGTQVYRGIAVGTRAELFRAVVTAIHQDADTNGIYSLDLDTFSGGFNPTDTLPGMSLDIGTTAGAHDVGTVRIRFYNSDADTVTIAETAPADLPVQVGDHVTAIKEYLPWAIPKRIVLTYDGGGNIVSVTEYLDYDLAFSSGAHPFAPKGNISAGHNSDGTVKHVQPFGWVDPGETFRTVHLSALDSVMHNVGATLSTVLWYVEDGTILGGGSVTDPEIDVTFPVGFRNISLFVQDSFGRQDLFYRHLPIWVDDPDAPTALRNFNVTSDETEAGREMQLEFFGVPNQEDDTVIPERSLVCYFEEPSWTGGDTPPQSYRQQMMGWVSDDDPLLKLEASTYGIRIGGTQHYKASFHANSITLIDTGSTPTTYTEMQDMTVDRVLDFSLIATDTLRSLANVYYSGVTAQVEAMTLPLGDAWTQLTELSPRAAMSGVGCDSLGNIFIRRGYNFLNDGNRMTVQEAISLTNADWTDADGLDLPTTKINRVGMVTSSAELWNAGDRILYASQAPGLRSGYGTGQPKMPDQFLQLPTPQANLNTLAGLFYWHENNPRPSVTVTLLGNLDVLEPCWQQPALINWAADTIRGTTLTDAPFLVKHISIQHTNSPDASNPPKRITLTLEQATDGAAGETAPVLQMEGITQLPDTTCDVTAAFTDSIVDSTVEFTDTSTGDLLIGWLWDFGDGSPFSNEENPTHIYAAADTYTVTLVVASECGSFDLVSHDVTISTVTNWCRDFDFTIDEQGWADSGSSTAIYSAGVGWVNSVTNAGGMSIRYFSLPANCNIGSVELFYHATCTGSGQMNSTILTFVGAPIHEGHVSGNVACGSSQDYMPSFDGTNVDSVQTSISIVFPGDFSANGAGVITEITLRGVGVNPFGADNCV
jgi:PKD repeat protein